MLWGLFIANFSIFSTVASLIFGICVFAWTAVDNAPTKITVEASFQNDAFQEICVKLLIFKKLLILALLYLKYI